MNHMSLTEHLKMLRTAIPTKQRDTENNSLPIFRKLKDMQKNKENKNAGIFEKHSFCIPLLDPQNDPPPDKVTEIVKGIFLQGGKIVEFSTRINDQYSQFVLASQNSKIQEIRQRLSGYIKYEMMVSYGFVVDSLKRLKKMKHEDYLLYDNSDFLDKEANEARIAREKLEAEKPDQYFIRPKLFTESQQTKKQEAKEETPHVKNQSLKFESKQIEEQTKPMTSENHNDNGGQKNEIKDENQYQQFSRKGMSDFSEDNFDDDDSSIDQDEIIQVKDLKKLQENENQMAQEKPSQLLKGEVQAKAEKGQVQENGQKGKKKEKPPERYHRNQQYRPKQTDQKPKTEQQTSQNGSNYFPWEPRWSRKQRSYYVPPKNLASHSFPTNDRICKVLSEMHQIYVRCRDQRQHLYLQTIAKVKFHPKELHYADDVDQIKNISRGMRAKIKEIIKTGTIAKMHGYQVKEQLNVCKELEQVWGIGSKKAKELFGMGIKTVSDLQKRPDLISKNMAIGLKYFEQFSQRIPRDKVTRMFQEFKKIFYNLVCSDKIHSLQVVGSYRRGKATCGDIDVLVCRNDSSVEPKLLMNLVAELQSKGFMTESLSQPRLFDGRNCSAYMGVCYFQGQHHRIDIKHYPVEQYAFALMYFTGSDRFNRQMRLAAHCKGLQLSDHGLKKKQRNGKRCCWKGGDIPILRTQEEIFAFLGQEYCTPAERQI